MSPRSANTSAVYSTPEIFNTDQGCQFTSDAFTGVVKLHDIAISMDGRGRALDNIFVERLWRSVKHEDVYLKGYVNMPRLQLGLTVIFHEHSPTCFSHPFIQARRAELVR